MPFPPQKCVKCRRMLNPDRTRQEANLCGKCGQNIIDEIKRNRAFAHFNPPPKTET